MVENIRIYINEVDYTEYAVIENFEIDLRERDYGASVSFFLPYSQLSGIIPSAELKILDGEKLIFAGIIQEIQFKEKTKEKILINVNCGNFNIIPTRRTISGVIDPEDYAGNLVRRYIEKFLSEEGIVEGVIEQGIQLYETEYYDWDTLSIAEILNNLADASGFEWYIDMRKQLHFGKLNPSPTYHTSEETRLIPQNHNYWDLEINTSLQNYRNKVFVIGGEPIEEVPEENLNYDYLLKVFVQNDNEIQKMAELNNDSGVWGYVINDPNIVTLEDAINKANSELEKYGQIPININVRTKIDYFSVGDTINVDLPLYGITNATFIIESIRIEFFGKDLTYNLQLTNKTAQAGQKEDLYKFFEKMVKEIKRNNRTIQRKKEGGGGGTTPPPDDIVPQDYLTHWLDMQDESKIELLGNALPQYPPNTIYRIMDKRNTDDVIQSGNIQSNPTFVKDGGFNWMRFYPVREDIYGSKHFYRQAITLDRFWDVRGDITVFVVYKDTGYSDGYYSIESFNSDTGVFDEYRLTFPGYSAPIGTPIYGGAGSLDTLIDPSSVSPYTELYINGIKVDIETQKRIRNTPVVLCLKNIPNGGFSGTFGENRINPDVPIPNWQESQHGDKKIFTAENPYFWGSIAEILVYETILPQMHIENISNYLMQKYNIS